MKISKFSSDFREKRLIYVSPEGEKAAPQEGQEVPKQNLEAIDFSKISPETFKDKQRTIRFNREEFDAFETNEEKEKYIIEKVLNGAFDPLLLEPLRENGLLNKDVEQNLMNAMQNDFVMSFLANETEVDGDEELLFDHITDGDVDNLQFDVDVAITPDSKDLFNVSINGKFIGKVKLPLELKKYYLMEAKPADAPGIKIDVEMTEVEIAAAERARRIEESLAFVGAGTRRDLMKLDLDAVKLPKEKVMENEEFIKQAEKQKQTFKDTNLNLMSQKIRNENLHFDVSQWNPSSVEGVKIIMAQFNALGLPINEPMYQQMFFLFNDRLKQQTVTINTADDEALKLREAYINPLNNMDLLRVKDPAYYAALHFLMYVKINLHADLVEKNLYFDQKTKMGSDPVGRRLANSVHELVGNVKETFRSKDYGMMAVYAGSIFALHKVWKNMDQKTKDEYKWLWWIPGIYGAHVILKEAGYDVPEMMGLTDTFDDIANTSLDIRTMDPEMAEKLGGKFVMKTADLNMKNLYDAYESSRTQHVFFIDPAKFFPTEFIGLTPSMLDAKVDKRAMSPSLEKYHKFGQKLYLLVELIEKQYGYRIRPDIQVPFHEFLDFDPQNKGTVRHYLNLLKQKDPTAAEIEAGVADKELEKLFGLVGKREDGLFSVKNSMADRPGHLPGEVKGYPVIFVNHVAPDGERYYLIYRKDKYGGKVAGDDFIAKVPMKGDESLQKAALEDAIKNIDKKVEDELKAYFEPKAETYKNLRFESGKWKVDIEVNTSDLGGLGITAPSKDISSFLNINPNGGIEIDYYTGAISENPINHLMMERVLQQGDLGILKSLNSNKKLSIDSFDKTNSTVTFNLIENGQNVQFRLKFIAGKFEFAPGPGLLSEAELVNNPVFIEAIKNSMANIPEFLNARDRLSSALENASENWIEHVAKSLVQWFPDGADLSVFSGSVKENFTMGIYNFQRDFLLRKFALSIKDLNSLKDVELKFNAIVAPGIREIAALPQRLASLQQGNTDVEAANFKREIVSELFSAGIESKSYSYWRSNYLQRLFAYYGTADFQEDDISKIRQLIEVYDFYMAGYDNAVIDNAQPGTPAFNEYQKAAQAANYVSAQIFGYLHINGKEVIPPAQAGVWLINMNNVVQASGFEVADATPTEPMPMDFPEFTSEADLANPDAILPRMLPAGGLTIRFSSTNRIDTFLSRYNAITNSSGVTIQPELTQFEKTFQQEVFSKIDQLQRDMIRYQPNQPKFNQLKDSFNIIYDVKVDRVNKTVTIKEKSGINLIGWVKTVENRLNNLRRTTSKSDQMAMMRDIIGEELGKEIHGKQYFNNNVWEAILQWFRDKF